MFNKSEQPVNFHRLKFFAGDYVWELRSLKTLFKTYKLPQRRRGSLHVRR